jgi:hypothetical protein
LRGNDTTFSQCCEQQLKVWLLEERFGWTFGVRRVGDDHVEVFLVFLEELEAIAHVDSNIGSLEADSHLGKVPLREANHGLYGKSMDVA